MSEKLEEFLKIEKEKELYKYIIKLTPEEALELLYALPKKKVKHACFIVFAFCDYYAKIGKQKILLKFVTPLYAKVKTEPKFRANIIATLNFLLDDKHNRSIKKKIDDENNDQDENDENESPINSEWEDDKDEKDETKDD